VLLTHDLSSEGIRIHHYESDLSRLILHQTRANKDALIHTIRGPLVLSSQRFLENWGPTCFSKITKDDLNTLLDFQPELLLFGGATRTETPTLNTEEIMHFFLHRGIGCEIMNTKAAIKTYTMLSQDQRPVVAVLFLK
jgi:uncharacterized protein